MTTSVHRGRGRAIRLAVLAGTFALLGTLQLRAETVFTISHAPVPTPTLIDLGEPGESVGDIRIFHFDAVTDDGSAVLIDWIMTTTAIDAPEAGVDTRFNTGVFSVEGTDNQLILEGVALYAGLESTMAVSASAIRVVTGGSGRYAGASGWVESTHLVDGSWTHVFYLE